MDYRNLKKPDHVKDYLWRQHLDWMEVVGKQMEENLRVRRREKENSRSPDPRR